MLEVEAALVVAHHLEGLGDAVDRAAVLVVAARGVAAQDLQLLRVLERAGVDFGRFQDALGRIWEVPKPHFERFLDASACSCTGVAWML